MIICIIINLKQIHNTFTASDEIWMIDVYVCALNLDQTYNHIKRWLQTLI